MICREQIDAKRTRPGVDELDRFLNVANLEYRQDGTKDLFLHRGGLRRNIHQHSGRQKPVNPIMLPAVVDGSTREQSDQTIKVMKADDATVVRAFLGIFSVKLKQGFFPVPQKLRRNILEEENVVGRGTCLAGIEPTPVRNPASRDPQIG